MRLVPPKGKNRNENQNQQPGKRSCRKHYPAKHSLGLFRRKAEWHSRSGQSIRNQPAPLRQLHPEGQ
eukprot:gene18171-21685_t